MAAKMDLPDELVVLEEKRVSLEQVGNAGVKDLREIRMCSVRKEDDSSIHTIRFVGDASLEIHYSKDGKALFHKANGLKFERLGDQILISIR